MITTHLSTLFKLNAGERLFRHHSNRNSVLTGISASTTQTQLAATQLLDDVNVVATVANDDDAVKLMPISTGEKITVENAGANRLQVFPYFGENLGQGTDTSITIDAGVTEDFDGLSAGLSTQFGEGYIKSTLSSSIDNAVAIWNGTTGRLLDSTLVYITSTGLGVFFENPAAPLHAHFDHNTTNTSREVARITRTTSGTAAAGIGAHFGFEVETATGPQNLELVANVGGVCTDVSSGSEVGALVFRTMKAGAAATEDARISTAGFVSVVPLDITDQAVASESVSLQLSTEPTDTSNGYLQFDHYSATGTTSPFVRIRKAAGTKASPTVVVDNEVLMRLGGMGYDGSAFQDAAMIRFVVNGTPGANDMPGSIEFFVTPDGSTSLALAATFLENGDLDLSASKTLSWNGAAILADSSGTMTLSNIDAIDSTTLTTLQDALEVDRTEHTTQTTNSTPVVIGSAAITEDTSLTFTVRGHGRENATGDTLSMRIDGCIRNEGGTTGFVGEALRIRNGDSGAATWDLNVVADDTSDELDVQVTGEASHTIDWRVTIDTITE